MAAAFYSQHFLPEALTSQYSVLHQERLYLLNALTEEENRGESLTNILTTLQAQIHQIEATEPTANTKRLRQQVKAVRNKLGACQHRERALAANLTNVVAQMEGLKRYQWRSAQEQYAIQLQQAQQHAQNILMMSPSRPAFALRSPANIDLADQMRYMTLGATSGQVFGNRASLDSYMGSLNQPFAPANMQYTSYAETAPEQMQILGSPFSQDLSEWSGLSENHSRAMSISSPGSAISTTFPCISPTTKDWTIAKTSELGRQRASSMLATVQEHPTVANTAVRRLSLLDGGAALKLERQAAEERAGLKSFNGAS